MKHFLKGLVAVLMLVLAFNAVSAQTVTLTFDDFPLGTPITDQYQPQGVVFDPGPTLNTDGANPTSPVLRPSTGFTGDIMGRFVDPATGAPTTVDFLGMDLGDAAAGTVTVRWFDSSGNLLGETTNPGSAISRVEVSQAGIASFAVLDGGDTYGLDNLTFNAAPVAQAAAVVVGRPTLDDRINRFDSAAPIAVYANSEGGVDVYTIDDSDGVFLFNTGDISDAACDGSMIASQGDVSLYRTSDCLYQMNAPQYNGKVYVLRFEFVGVLVPYTSYEID